MAKQDGAAKTATADKGADTSSNDGARDWSKTLFLPREAGRFRGFLRGAMRLKEHGLRFRGGAAAIGKIIVFVVFQAVFH